MKVLNENRNVVHASIGPPEAPKDNYDPMSVSAMVTVSVRVLVTEAPLTLVKLLAAAGVEERKPF